MKYSSHFHANVYSSPYSSPIQQKLIKPEELVSPFPLQMRSVGGLTTHENMAVVLEHSIFVFVNDLVTFLSCAYIQL